MFFVFVFLGDKLWWADQGTDQIGTCNKKDGGNWKILRNSTSPMMHMKIYNETVQKGAELPAGEPFSVTIIHHCVLIQAWTHLFMSLLLLFDFFCVFCSSSFCVSRQ